MSKVHSLMPSMEDIKASIGPILRGTALGTVFGILPGSHTVIASFSSYTLEKKLAKDPSRFGKGAIEGVAGPEAANNAAAQTCFIPLLTLGIPTGAVMALMVGAMTIQGIAPGPQVMTQKPDLFWGMIASMWIGNLMLVILNRMRRHTGEIAQLHAELVDLCGVQLMDIVARILSHKDALLKEFQVCFFFKCIKN